MVQLASNGLSVAQQVRSCVMCSGERMWSVEDFAGPPSAVNNELRRLVARGELARVRRGIYWHGRQSRFGMVGAPTSDAVRKLLGNREAIGATGWQAAKLLGLSTQVAPVESLATTGRPPTGLRNVRLASRTARSGRREAKLNGLEVTILEAIEGWERYVEVDGATALARFRDALARNDVHIDRMVAASRTEPPGVRERLRAILIYAGHKEQADHIPAARDPRTRERALRVIGYAV